MIPGNEQEEENERKKRGGRLGICNGVLFICSSVSALLTISKQLLARQPRAVFPVVYIPILLMLSSCVVLFSSCVYVF